MIINGKAYWAKVVGPPQGGFDKSVLEWSIDLTLDEANKEKVIAEGLKTKIKNKGDDRGDFIQFKRKAIKADGSNAKPIEIVTKSGKPWTGEKIGNGSKVDIKFLVNEVPYGGKVFKKPGIIGIRVVDLVPYEGGTYEDFEFEEDENGNESWENA